MFITFEGPDATGKSTQVQRLYEHLVAAGKKVIMTKEPGNPRDAACVQIRQVLLNPEYQIHDRCALLLFLADRAQHMQTIVIPYLNEGFTVISDRSSISTLVYHLASKTKHWDFSDLSKYELATMLNFAQPREPDLCFIAQSQYEFSEELLKVAREADRIEQKGDGFHDRVHMYFQSFAIPGFNEESTYFEDQKFFPKKVAALPAIPVNTEEEILGFVLREIREAEEYNRTHNEPGVSYATHNLD